MLPGQASQKREARVTTSTRGTRFGLLFIRSVSDTPQVPRVTATCCSFNRTVPVPRRLTAYPSYCTPRRMSCVSNPSLSTLLVCPGCRVVAALLHYIVAVSQCPGRRLLLRFCALTQIHELSALLLERFSLRRAAPAAGRVYPTVRTDATVRIHMHDSLFSLHLSNSTVPWLLTARFSTIRPTAIKIQL